MNSRTNGRSRRNKGQQNRNDRGSRRSRQDRTGIPMAIQAAEQAEILGMAREQGLTLFVCGRVLTFTGKMRVDDVKRSIVTTVGNTLTRFGISEEEISLERINRILDQQTGWTTQRIADRTELTQPTAIVPRSQVSRHKGTGRMVLASLMTTLVVMVAKEHPHFQETTMPAARKIRMQVCTELRSGGLFTRSLWENLGIQGMVIWERKQQQIRNTRPFTYPGQTKANDRTTQQTTGDRQLVGAAGGRTN